MGSRVSRLSSCGTRSQLHHSTWTLPEPGVEPVSPALASRFLTTGPPMLQEEPVLLFKLVWMFKDFCGENWQGRRGSKNTNLTSNSKFLMGPTQPGHGSGTRRRVGSFTFSSLPFLLCTTFLPDLEPRKKQWEVGKVLHVWGLPTRLSLP